MSIRITTDSTADLSPEQIKENGIGVFPLHVILGDKEFSDGVDITPWDIFSFVEQTNELPSTSAISEEEYAEYFENALKEVDEVIHFDISRGVSVTAENALSASKRFGGKVKVIDTKHLSTGQGLLVMRAVDLLKEGKTADEIESEVLALRDKVQTSFVVNTVDYLYKGGRCTMAAAVASKVLKIHPAISMDGGKLKVKKKYIGSLKRCIRSYVDDLAEEFKSYDDTRVFITHSCCSDEIVAEIKSEVEEKFNFKEIVVTTAGSVITSHCGQSTLGVLFITK